MGIIDRFELNMYFLRGAAWPVSQMQTKTMTGKTPAYTKKFGNRRAYIMGCMLS